MSISIALDAALSGLKIAQLSMNTVSNNIANASTPGYTAKIQTQQGEDANGIGVGVLAGPITRNIDATLIADINTQTSTTAAYNINQTYFDSLQSYQGAPGAGGDLSSQLSNLQNAFTQLSDNPGDPTLQSETVTAATQTANAINGMANQLTTLRTQTESDMTAAVTSVNQDLKTIATLNNQITQLSGEGQDTTDLQDQRDSAVQDLSQYIQVTVYQNNSNGQLTVSTGQGQILADNTAHLLYFQPSTVLPTSYYPGGGLNGITVGSPSGPDIAGTSLGGQIGALLTLRDQTLPQYQAQLDEFSQQLASRFQNEGLKLYTDQSGNVPASVAPPGIVGYSGFSSEIQVNSAILNNPSLIQSGTTGTPQPAGSNEIINNINQYTFGTYQYQQASGTANISAGNLTALLGLSTSNAVTGSVDLATFSPDFSTVPGAVLPGNFNLTLGGTTKTINVLPTDNATSLVNNINAAFGFNAANINSSGQLNIYFNGTITLANGTIGAPTMAALGFNFGITPPPNPSFQVQVGTQPSTTISIAPTDTSVQLLAKLNAIQGLTATLNGAGQLVMTPTNGGALTVTDGNGAPLTAMGVITTNVSPTPFRQSNLGPAGNLSTGLLANSTLSAYISSIISVQGEAANANKTMQAQETSYLQTLQTRNSNESGVNIDTEMAELIKIQSAYGAAAKVVTSTQTLFNALLASVNP